MKDSVEWRSVYGLLVEVIDGKTEGAILANSEFCRYWSNL